MSNHAVSAELMQDTEETNRTVGTAFYNKSEPRTFPGQKYLHMCCPVSEYCLGNIRSVCIPAVLFAVNTV